jgi:hypothetical protein
MPHFRLLAIALFLLTLALPLEAQSGRATFSGWVAFDGIAYADKQPTAKIELFHPDDKEHPVASTTTDEHGHYTLQPAALGELTLRVSAPDFATYEIPIYLPSDFNGNLATLLKKPEPKPAATSK